MKVVSKIFMSIFFLIILLLGIILYTPLESTCNEKIEMDQVYSTEFGEFLAKARVEKNCRLLGVLDPWELKGKYRDTLLREQDIVLND